MHRSLPRGSQLALTLLLTTLLLAPGAASPARADTGAAPSVALQVTLDIEESLIRASAQIEPGADNSDNYFLFDLSSDLSVLMAYVTEAGRRPDLTQQATHVPVPHHRDVQRYKLRIPGGVDEPLVVIVYEGKLADDVDAGEIEGQVHNFSVQAHISERGVFLSDNSRWAPTPVDGHGGHPLCHYEVTVHPDAGWVFVATGDPADEPSDKPGPATRFRTPRPAEGVALAGNQLGTFAGVSDSGVEIVVHTSEGNARLAPMFLGAAQEYLALYEPLLGPYPYQRFTIMENFFSSGFAYPGFTLMDGRVLGMGPRALMPGLLDHEMLHAWWGNGVYVSDGDGNWCEAITSHHANMSRYGLQGEEQRSQDYRRGNLMKLAADPTLDAGDGPALDRFSRDPACDRYVGYDKGAMVFHMIRQTLGDDAYWTGVKRFSTDFMGKHATWDDIVTSLDPDDEHGVAALIEQFVRQPGAPSLAVTKFLPAEDSLTLDIDAGAGDWDFDLPVRLYTKDGGHHDLIIHYPDEHTIPGAAANVTHVELDPDFDVYRLMPASQVLPTINNTLAGDLHFVVGEEHPSAADQFMARYPEATHSAQPVSDRHLFILGAAGAEAVPKALALASNPVTVGEGWFEVEGVRYDKPTQAMLHSFRHPDESGRYATLFVSNGEVGWQKLRLVTHYRRDTTIVWEDGAVITRLVHEPDRRVPLGFVMSPEKLSYD
ncbi:MAG: M1 family metallopeptidase [Phycisphaerales bacterium JB038]